MPAKAPRRNQKGRRRRRVSFWTNLRYQSQLVWLWLGTRFRRGTTNGAFRVPIGMVSVDSGLLAICDPCYLVRTPGGTLPLLPLDEGMEPYAAVSQRGQQFGDGSWGSAVVVGTGIGDGLYPVYWQDGRIVVDVADWHWDAEHGKGVYKME